MMSAQGASAASSRLEIVDTHVHFWNLLHPELRWGWLAPEAQHPILGNFDAIKSTAYEADALWAEARFAGVSSFVHVQAADSPNPVAETRWLTEMAAASGGIPAAIVAQASLGAAEADELLDGHAQSPLFRGIRDFGTETYLASGELAVRYEASLARLARDGFVLDLDCEWPNMAAAVDMAGRHPELRIVLEHVGYPRRRDDDYFREWAKAIGVLAAADNVVCKVSGIAMTDRLFTIESLTPWVETCLDAFGAARCIVGSNWPVDRLCSSYDVIMGCYRALVSSLSEDEQRRILSGNARDCYRI
jgi:predicted TIM-barrel fold metal-dependent hydrolase